MFLGICGQRGPRSACAFVQSDQGLCGLLSLETTESMNGEQSPRLYYAHEQDDLNMRMFKDTFSQDTDHMVNVLKIKAVKSEDKHKEFLRESN